MSLLIDEKQLKIINLNRLVSSLNGLSSVELLNKIQENYIIAKKGDMIYYPTQKNEIAMYLESNWYSLTAKQKKFNSVTASLDQSILSANILKPILNIQDEKTDKNISFFDGTIDLQNIKEKVDNGEFSVAFILKSIQINTLKEVADNKEIMPPKSTYIKPKLRSGLTIYPIG